MLPDFCVLFCCILACAAAASAEYGSNSKNIDLIREIHYLLPSAPNGEHNRRVFPTEQHYIDKHVETIRRMKDPTYEHFGKQHTFIVKVQEDCGWDCHRIFIDALSSGETSRSARERDTGPENERYGLLTSEHAYVSMSLEQIEAIVTTNPAEILAYAPLLPQAKISAHVRELAQSCSHSNLLIKISALSEKESGVFYQFLQSLQSVSFDAGDMRPHQMSLVGLELGTCSDVERVAALLAERREVLKVEERFPVELHNRWSQGVCQSGSYDKKPMTDNEVGLDGTGQIVGVSDTGIDQNSCYFFDSNTSFPFDYIDHNHRKIVYYYSGSTDKFDNDGHGSHVAGTVAGYSSKAYGDFQKYNGVASGAKIAFYDIGYDTNKKTGFVRVPSDYGDIFTKQYAAGARVFTNSWGSSYSSGATKYTDDAAEVDKFLANNRDCMIFYSAGNSGTSNGGVQNVVSPSTFKNGIAVGASMNDYDSWQAYGDAYTTSQYTPKAVAYFSSRGPAYDGRTKPDIMAPGMWVTSASAQLRNDTHEFSCSVKALTGTSMASPAAAASAAIIRQYFTDGWYPRGYTNKSESFIPSGALLKAMLISSGQKMSYTVCEKTSTSGCVASITSYPSNIQGYGRLQLNKILHFGAASAKPITLYVAAGAYNRTHSLYKTVKHREYKLFTFSTSSQPFQAPIRVTMVYVDTAGSATVVSPMINVLKLTVNSSAGVLYSPYESSNNTVSMIDIFSPLASTTFTVKVYGKMVSTSNQPFALVISQNVTAATYTEDAWPDPSTLVDSSVTLSAFAVKGIISLVLILAFTGAITAAIYWYNFYRALIQHKLGRIRFDDVNDEMVFGRAAAAAVKKGWPVNGPNPPTAAAAQTPAASAEAGRLEHTNSGGGTFDNFETSNDADFFDSDALAALDMMEDRRESQRTHFTQPPAMESAPPPAMESAPPPAAPVQKTIKVRVPEGAEPGATLEIDLPSGNIIYFEVPPKAHAGQVFKIAYEE